MPYAVTYDPRAVKELAKLDRAVVRRIVRAVEGLGADPRPDGARSLVGYDDLWRVRVGNYRIVYTIRDAELFVIALRIAHRSTAYRNLDPKRPRLGA